MTLRAEGQPLPKDRQHALWVFTAQDQEEAESLRTLACRLSYDGTQWFLTDGFGGWNGTVSSLETVELAFAEAAAHRRERLTRMVGQ